MGASTCDIICKCNLGHKSRTEPTYIKVPKSGPLAIHGFILSCKYSIKHQFRTCNKSLAIGTFWGYIWGFCSRGRGTCSLLQGRYFEVILISSELTHMLRCYRVGWGTLVIWISYDMGMLENISCGLCFLDLVKLCTNVQDRGQFCDVGNTFSRFRTILWGGEQILRNLGLCWQQCLIPPFCGWAQTVSLLDSSQRQNTKS